MAFFFLGSSGISVWYEGSLCLLRSLSRVRTLAPAHVLALALALFLYVKHTETCMNASRRLENTN